MGTLFGPEGHGPFWDRGCSSTESYDLCRVSFPLIEAPLKETNHIASRLMMLLRLKECVAIVQSRCGFQVLLSHKVPAILNKIAKPEASQNPEDLAMSSISKAEQYTLHAVSPLPKISQTQTLNPRPSTFHPNPPVP